MTDYLRPEFIFIGIDECNLGERRFVRAWNKIDAWVKFRKHFGKQYEGKINPKYWTCTPY